ncbi:hypothetical protein CEXT_371101 [Caerostris extrusa]|uniref:Secreted protein n=1 Tax=Caerostris extrusa TaxID=172846 RepID=A0AAV4RM20_CAEEX|nr:hypothetical protein CEXT_371101 [Caerostris extrusa]
MKLNIAKHLFILVSKISFSVFCFVHSRPSRLQLVLWVACTRKSMLLYDPAADQWSNRAVAEAPTSSSPGILKECSFTSLEVVIRSNKAGQNGAPEIWVFV